MKPAIDAGNLIACSACAKAKARCDKRLPTCSRCLYKRLKCEPRPPRRYPETSQLLQTHAQSQPISPPSSTTPSPPNQSQNHSTTNETFDPSSNLAQLHTFEGMQWSQSPPTDMGGCPGDLNIQPFGSSVQHFDSGILTDPGYFPTESIGMDYDVTDFEMQFQTHQPPNFGILHNSNVSSESAPQQAHPILPQPSNSHINEKSDISLQDDWPCFQCNPPNEKPINPRTGSEYLRLLEESLNEQPVLNTLDTFTDFGSAITISIEPVQESLRDKLMVISQGFLSRARDVHRSRNDDALLNGSISSNAKFTGFFILPPPLVLDAFLRTYASRVEPYIPFFPAGTINLSKLIASNDEKSSILLLLLMIALGAMGSSVPEARRRASGLVEICRICMFDIMEKNVQLAAHPVVLRCVILYLYAAAWSGTKWHMNFAAAQLRMYLSILRCSHLLNARNSSLSDGSFLDPAAWEKWQIEEGLNRLTYSWVCFDQEMSLFHDRQPELDINELNAAIPDKDELWTAPSAEAWKARYEEARQLRHTKPQSLAKLFNQFMSEELSGSVDVLSLTELRLILHPLQALIYHLNKSLVYFFNSRSQRLLQRLFTQMEEVQYLLQQWYTISNRALERSSDSLEISRCNLALFHLISLNAIAYFPDIERFSRGELAIEKFRDSIWAGKRCAEESAQIWTHCGQVIRHFRQMPALSRPYWWGACIYRVALLLWATSLATVSPKNGCPTIAIERILIDALPFEHPSVVRYLRHQDAFPTLSNSDGGPAIFNSPVDIITHCIGVLKEKQPSSQLDEGIAVRLSVLVGRWSS